MIAEKFPGIAELSTAEKRELAIELFEASGENEEVVELDSGIAEVLQQRMDHYLANPETGKSWDQVREMAKARRK